MDLSTQLIFQLLDSRGTGRYGLSAVTQKEHALQSADLATKRGLGEALVIAALFHDLGHLLVGDDVNLAQQGVDDLHEETSANALAKLFGNDVAEPVRLHVAAKRYLCAVNPAYYDKLSEDFAAIAAAAGWPNVTPRSCRFRQARTSRGRPRLANDRRRGKGRGPKNARAGSLPRHGDPSAKGPRLTPRPPSPAGAHRAACGTRAGRTRLSSLRGRCRTTACRAHFPHDLTIARKPVCKRATFCACGKTAHGFGDSSVNRDPHRCTCGGKGSHGVRHTPQAFAKVPA